MKWETIDLSKEKPVIPGCIDIDASGSTFVSVTFKTEDGSIMRIRQTGYSTIIERKTYDTEDKWKVTCKTSLDTWDRIFDSKDLAAAWETMMMGAGAETEMDKLKVRKNTDD